MALVVELLHGHPMRHCIVGSVRFACMQVPNGELNSEQLRFLGDSVRKYGEKGCLDITTRANIQLRGIPLEDAGPVFEGLQGVGLTSVQTGETPRSLYESP